MILCFSRNWTFHKSGLAIMLVTQNLKGNVHEEHTTTI